MEMTQKERSELIKDIANVVLNTMNKRKMIANEEEEWISTKEAAEILSISERRLRVIKDRFVYKKCGENGQGQLRFLKKYLIESYINGK